MYNCGIYLIKIYIGIGVFQNDNQSFIQIIHSKNCGPYSIQKTIIFRIKNTPSVPQYLSFISIFDCFLKFVIFHFYYFYQQISYSANLFSPTFYYKIIFPPFPKKMSHLWDGKGFLGGFILCVKWKCDIFCGTN